MAESLVRTEGKIASSSQAAPTRARLPRSAAALAMGLVWLLAWQLVASLSGASEDFLPGPMAVLSRLAKLATTPIGDGTLWVHVAWSLVRFATGFLAAVAVGAPLGFVMAYFRPLDELVTPLFELFRCVPPIAWAPFALLWFGATLGSQTFVIFTSALPPILLSSYEGFRQTDRTLIDAARNLGARPASILLEVGLPSSIPILIAGIRIGLANGWMALVGAEIIAGNGSHAGLGYLILIGQQSLQADLTIGAMVMIGLVGALLDAGVRRIERHFSAWRVSLFDGHGGR